MDERVERVLYEVAARVVAPVLAPIYSGVASILTFHRVVGSSRGPRPGWLRGLEVEVALIEELVARLRRTGHEFVSIDELRAVLTERRTRAHKLVVMTFDDGYADAHHTVLPLLAAERIPFTLYLTTDFPDRRIVPWWYLLDDLLARGPHLHLRLEGVEHAYSLETPAQRDVAFAEIGQILDAGSEAERRARAEQVFGVESVEEAMERLYLSWDQVAELAAHPLVTIGAHTVSHAPLKLLSREKARWEMLESRQRIEARIGKSVRHFAYPYGFPSLVGAREYELARECGFSTAVTTRVANVFYDNAKTLQCLPRIRGQSVRHIELSMAGVVAALRYRGRRVITV